MHGSWIGLAALLVAAATATAAPDDGDESALEELAARNQALEERVKALEQSSLEEDVQTYLDQSAPGAEGAESVLSAPGALKVKLFGQIRVRGEWDHHLYAPGDPDGTQSFGWVHQRVRLGADVQVLEKVSVTIVLQDVRAWGQEGSTVGMLNGVDLKEGFMRFTDLFDQPVTLEAGRFVLSYGSQRLVGALDWVDQGRSYDGLRFKTKREEIWLDLFAVKVNETFAANNDFSFVGLYGGWRWLEAYALMQINEADTAGETGTGRSTFVTFGFRIARTTGPWDYTLEIPFQLGELNGDDLSAWAAAFTIGYTFEKQQWKPRVAFEFDYASGDRNPTDGNVEQMQTLYPTNHLWYGYMDMVGWSNIMDFRLTVSVKPTGQTSLQIDYHYFLRPEETGAWINAAGAVVRPGAAGAGSTLGSEFDLTFTWTPSPPVSVQCGWSIFLPGSFVEDTGPSPTSQWFYLQGQVKF